jgi:uncharacterized protein YfaQ (DUF2300 family)
MDGSDAMQDNSFIDRLFVEKKELDQRLEKLKAFLDCPTGDISAVQLELLAAQEKAMTEYSRILDLRIGGLLLP